MSKRFYTRRVATLSLFQWEEVDLIYIIMYRRKIGGIYIIEIGDYYYIGKSVDIYMRWNSHYNDLTMGKHSSPLLQEMFNKYGVTSMNMRILEYISRTEYKSRTKLKGKEADKQFNRYLLNKEKEWMNKYSINYALNKMNKHFS